MHIFVSLRPVSFFKPQLLNLRPPAHFPPTQVFIKERLIVTRERSSGKGSSYGPGPYFLSKLCAELPVTALFPVLFGSIMYPLAGLQVSEI